MFARISEKIEGYIENKIELVKLDIEERTSKIIIKLVKVLLLGMTATIFLLFLNIGIALLLNAWLGSAFWGFIIVAGFYMVVFIILYTFRDHKIFTSINLFIKTNDD